MQVIIGGVAIVGLDDRGVLHTMVAVVQVVNMGTKVCITWWTRRKDDMMHPWMIPWIVTAAALPTQRQNFEKSYDEDEGTSLVVTERSHHFI